MSSRSLIFFVVWVGIFLLLEVYAYQAVRAAGRELPDQARRAIGIGYWSFSAFIVGALIFYVATMQHQHFSTLRAWLSGLFFANIVFKLIVSLFMAADDVRRLLFALCRFAGMQLKLPGLTALPLSRSEFLSKAALALATVPAVGMVYGVARGGHQYKVRHRKVVLPHLPPAFEGLKIVQLSDIHSGSFFNKSGVRHGIALANAQGADVIVFTGDLVNNIATEIEPWIDDFKKLHAPMGVFSIFGNHDYGDYAAWDSPKAKVDNLRRLADNHARLGWDLLMDEHRWLEKDGQRIALIGIQNWGARAGFPKYGNLAKAYAGTEEAAVKILLSHDPSHWRAQVVPEYPDIDLMLAGHTHGMQFGVDGKYYKWSPVQYVYPEWADMYQEGNQRLYVNRGFGFIGYPGRLGIWPEITVLELTRQ